MPQPFISVVMPVYNVEKYLKKSVSSVLNQTYEDIELVLIDDCTPDNSGQICDDFAKKDHRVKAIHLEKNGGLSNARNTGLNYVTGKYVLFMDSDDYIDADLFEQAVKTIDDNPADVVIWGITEEYLDQNDQLSSTKVVTYPTQILKTKEEVHDHVIHLEEKSLYGYAWNKLYNVEYLKKIGLNFEKITLIEDILFNVKFCMRINSMNILETPAHHYVKRLEDSLTAAFVIDYFKLMNIRVQAVYDQYIYWERCDASVKKILANIYARYIFSALQRNCDKRQNMTRKDRKIFLQKLYESQLFNDLIVYGNTNNKQLSILLKLLKNRSRTSCLIMGRFIYLIKSKLPMLFAKLK